MKKEYTKPEIRAESYAEFENVLTHACTKQRASIGCRYYGDLKPPGVDDFGDKLVGVTDWTSG